MKTLRCVDAPVTPCASEGGVIIWGCVLLTPENPKINAVFFMQILFAVQSFHPGNMSDHSSLASFPHTIKEYSLDYGNKEMKGFTETAPLLNQFPLSQDGLKTTSC